MRTRYGTWAALFLTLLASPYKAASQTASSAGPTNTSSAKNVMPEYIEEFFLSEAVRNEERGELQLTLAGMASRDHQSAADGASADLDVEFGVTDRLQLSLELPYGIRSTPTSEIPSQWSTISAGVFYQFIRSSHPFALSVGVGAGLPLNSRGEMTFQPELLMAKVVGQVQIHASFEPEVGGDDTSLAYNLAAVQPWPHHLYPTLEFNGRRNAAVNSFYITPGLYRHLPHRWEVGVGVPIGVGSRSSPVGAVFKMTWELGGAKDRD